MVRYGTRSDVMEDFPESQIQEISPNSSIKEGKKDELEVVTSEPLVSGWYWATLVTTNTEEIVYVSLPKGKSLTGKTYVYRCGFSNEFSVGKSLKDFKLIRKAE